MYSFDGKKLQALSEKRGLDQIGLARQMSVSHAAVGQWIRGEKKPTVSRLEQLTRILRCSPNALFVKL